MANSPLTLSELACAERSGDGFSDDAGVPPVAEQEPLLLAGDPPQDPFSLGIPVTDGKAPIHHGRTWSFYYGNDGDDVITLEDGYVYGEDGRQILTTDHDVNEVYGGAGNDRLRGNSGIDWLYGQGGDDIIHGGDNWDILNGGDGNDEVYGDAGDDRIAGGRGHDRLYGGEGEDTIFATDDDVGTDNSSEIYGEEGNDRLMGGRSGTTLIDGGLGNDRLEGGDSHDTMKGGAGDDVYTLVRTGDRVIEEADGGLDTVYAADDIVLSDHVENLVLTLSARNGTGNDLANRITIDGDGGKTAHGGGGDDVIIAGPGIAIWLPHGYFRDTLYGDAGNDTLIGDENGYDTLLGGKGNDTYVLTATTDRLVEVDAQGSDTVRASFSYTLLDHFEKLVLTGDTAVDGTGNAVGNALTGNGMANLLSGLGGNDTLYGGAGEDTLLGGSGNDWLDGGYGHDTLTGGTGADVFSFGVGFSRDEAMVSGGMLSASSDRVMDFAQGTDRIALSLKTFASLAKAGGTVGGVLTANLFFKGAYAQDADNFLLYDGKTGQLWYDANGSASVTDTAGTWTGKRLIATFTDKDGLHPTLSAADFQFIA